LGSVRESVNSQFRPRKKITGTAEADVVVRVRRRVVQIQRERAGIVAIVPIAAAFEGGPLF